MDNISWASRPYSKVRVENLNAVQAMRHSYTLVYSHEVMKPEKEDKIAKQQGRRDYCLLTHPESAKFLTVCEH